MFHKPFFFVKEKDKIHMYQQCLLNKQHWVYSASQILENRKLTALIIKRDKRSIRNTAHKY